MLSRNSAPEQTWKRCGENLVKYTPSGTYYVRVRVAGKLHVKSLETPVLTVARQRLNDEIHKLRARAASVMAVRAGKMRVADAVAMYREHLGGRHSHQAVHEKVLDGLVAIMAEFGRNGCPTSLRARLQGLGGQSLSGVQWNSRNNTVIVLRNVREIAVEPEPCIPIQRAHLVARNFVILVAFKLTCGSSLTRTR